MRRTSPIVEKTKGNSNTKKRYLLAEVMAVPTEILFCFGLPDRLNGG
ncbi:MAG: hypothetical protein IM558_12975 [Chitinophagaceae bacterium]|nr:hypothetical protein [Chitinophagaceae bacterium]MCA6489185.1 hypothetical protein [Chitinophagaceae bacterium]MCA6498628.1 hypothetical protein [Chitinophagaceae bacterium]MCA6513259.1 hypothetical protein [Chitinophagaceae bacterium]